MDEARTGEERPPERRRRPIAVASEQDRKRAFVNASRHSWIVRGFKIGLPVLAVAVTAIYALTFVANRPIRIGKAEIAGFSIDPSKATMREPKYDTFAKDGSHIKVRAKEAVTDIKMAGPIRLNEIVAEIIQPSGVATKLTAVWGLYDVKTSELNLHEKIDIEGTNGLKARLTQARVLSKEGLVHTTEPVEAELPTGRILANAMTVKTKTREATFFNEVAVRLFPGAAKAEGATAKAPRASAGMPGLTTRSDQPIDVWSETLDVNDLSKTAVFRNNVRVRQGESALNAPELEVHYVGKPVDGAGAAAQLPASEANGKSKLKAIFARGGVTLATAAHKATASEAQFDAESTVAVLIGSVVMTSGADRMATAERAEHNQTRDTTLLLRNVVVVQGQNKLTGQRLWLDRKAATTRLDGGDGGVQRGQRITAHLVQSEAQKAVAVKAAETQPSERPANSLFATSFKRDPKQPIDIDADSLDIDDKAKTAIFRGAVHARQGDFEIRTVELISHYTSETGLASALGPQPADVAGGKRSSGQLTKIEAKQKVVITTKEGQTVTGNWATFDVKTNISYVGGDVVLSQARTVVKGNRLKIDMTTGVANIEEDGVANAASGAPKGGRASFVTYPDEMKQLQDKKRQQTGGEASSTEPRRRSGGSSVAPAANPGGWSTSTGTGGQ